MLIKINYALNKLNNLNEINTIMAHLIYVYYAPLNSVIIYLFISLLAIEACGGAIYME